MTPPRSSPSTGSRPRLGQRGRELGDPGLVEAADQRTPNRHVGHEGSISFVADRTCTTRPSRSQAVVAEQADALGKQSVLDLADACVEALLVSSGRTSTTRWR
jgi:hypothetical protein